MGVLAGLPFPFPFSGAGARFGGKGQSKGNMDLSKYKELSFWVRGDGKRYIVQLQSAAVKDFDFHQVAFTATDRWSEVKIPLASLAQTGFGARLPWDKASHGVVGLMFVPQIDAGKAAGDFAVEIDQVALR